jgi:hypothetical protein
MLDFRINLRIVLYAVELQLNNHHTLGQLQFWRGGCAIDIAP